MARRISILGSTGSIGQNTVDLIRREPPGTYEVVALTGGRNIALLAQQAKELHAGWAVTSEPELERELATLLRDSPTKVSSGPDALVAVAGRRTDIVVSAIVGAAGLPPTLAAAGSTGVLALANKESLVCAGALLRDVCARNCTKLLPVDSEHSAIFQVLQGHDRSAVERVILTASGGPFRNWTLDQMAGATPQQAVAHPNWSMGQRISIDSASMFNKALELIEAKYLFDLQPNQIATVVHPQSIVHSLVEFCDGSVLAQMGAPDMRGPIGFALNWPERRPLPVEKLDLSSLSSLTFEQPNHARFPALSLAERVLRFGGLTGAILNGAKEIALDRFINGEIGYLQMADLVEAVVDIAARGTSFQNEDYDLGEVMSADRYARDLALGWSAEGEKIRQWR